MALKIKVKLNSCVANILTFGEQRKVDISTRTVEGILLRLCGEIRPLHMLSSKERIAHSAISFTENFMEYQETMFLRKKDRGDDPASSRGLLKEGAGEVFGKEYMQYLLAPFSAPLTDVVSYVSAFNSPESVVLELLEKGPSCLGVVSRFGYGALINAAANNAKEIMPEELRKTDVIKKIAASLDVAIAALDGGSGDEGTRMVKSCYHLKDEQKTNSDKISLDEIIESGAELSESKLCTKVRVSALTLLFFCLRHEDSERGKALDRLYTHTSKGGKVSSKKISGISWFGVTPKDIIGSVANKTFVRGAPYNGADGKLITKRTGELLITVTLPKQEEFLLRERIEEAGIGPITVGKKGLAYAEVIN